jgi:putative spermidine/putrescine transport system permease protein
VMAARVLRIVSIGYLCFILAALYFPFIVMAILSFQGPRGGNTFPLRGVSIAWYSRLFHPGRVTETSDVGRFLGDYLAAFGRSLVLAVLSMVIATVMAMMAAQAFRRKFRGSGLIFYVWLLGMIVPGVTVSLGLALFFRNLDVPLWWATTGLGVHVMWTLPFCLVICLTFFNRFDRSLEDASLTLGATRWQTFRYVTLPLMLPAISTSMLFGFTLSLDEFQRSLLVTGIEQTLPLTIMGSVTTGVTPTLYALGTLTTLISLTVVGLYFVVLSLVAKLGIQFRA